MVCIAPFRMLLELEDLSLFDDVHYISTYQGDGLLEGLFLHHILSLV